MKNRFVLSILFLFVSLKSIAQPKIKEWRYIEAGIITQNSLFSLKLQKDTVINGSIWQEVDPPIWSSYFGEVSA